MNDDTPPAEPVRISRLLNRCSLAIFALVAATSQGLYLWNRSAFWDGSALLFALERRRYEALKEIFWNNGIPSSYYLHRLVGFLPAPIVVYRLVYLAGLVLVAWLVFRILALGVPRLIALLAGVLSMLMPFSIISFDVSLVWALLFVVSFLAGVDMLLAAALARGTSIGRVRRGTMLALLAFSFFYGTFLFIGLVAVVVSAGAVIAGGRRSRAAVARLRTWPDVHALPFVFAGLKRLFLHPVARYSGYNEPAWLDAAQWRTLFALPGKYWQQLWDGVWAPGVSFPPSQTITIFVVAASVGLILWMGRSGRGLHDLLAQAEGWPWRRQLFGIAVSLACVYLCALPYFVVGRRDLLFTGYLSRDNLPVGLPIAAVLAMLLFALSRVRVALILAVMLATRLAFVQVDLARKWLDDGLTQQMIAAVVPQFPELQQAGVIVYEEHVMHFTHLEWLEFQEVLARGFGTETRIAFPTWELERCASLAACVDAFKAHPDDPLSQIAGARNARGCGLVVKAHIARGVSANPSWSDYAIGRRGGPALLRLASARIKIVTTLLGTLPCS